MNVAHDAPRTPVLRYPGAKNQLARWIISYMPAHESYTEAYCGSCAVLLNKRRARLEAVNDRSSEIVNFFSVLRSRPDELINQIWLTPWSAEEYTLAFAEASDDVERARRFYFRCWSSIRPFDDNPSFRRQAKLSRGKNGDRPPMVQAAKGSCGLTISGMLPTGCAASLLRIWTLWIFLSVMTTLKFCTT